MNEVKIIIADDHPIFRAGIKMVLSKESWIKIAEVSNGKELLAAVKNECPSVVLMDMRMPLMDGIEAAKKISAGFPTVKIIALTSFCTDEVLTDILEAGVHGFLLKNVVFDELVMAINAVLNGKIYFTQIATEKIAKIISQKSFLTGRIENVHLTEKEKQIICLITRQYSNKAIAEKLKIGKRTVESHRVRIMDKIGAPHVAAVVQYAHQNGLTAYIGL